jgi:hypothetical protein
MVYSSYHQASAKQLRNIPETKTKSAHSINKIKQTDMTHMPLSHKPDLG